MPLALRLALTLVLLLVPASAAQAQEFRSADLVDGTWTYTNGIGLALGANTDGLHREDYFAAVNPQGDDPTHIQRDLHRALTYDFFGSHRSTHNGDFQLPTDQAKFPYGTADLAQVTLSERKDELTIRLRWHAFPSPTTQIATLTFGTPASAERAWPRNAGLRSPHDIALTIGGTSAVLTAADGSERTFPVTAGDHTTETVVPLGALPAGAWTLTGGAGLADPADVTRYRTVPAGNATATAPGSGNPASAPTNVWTLLFADDEPWSFDERAQSDLLADGIATGATATLDPDDLREDRTERTPLRMGPTQRLYQSKLPNKDGIKRSGGAGRPQGTPGYGLNETWTYQADLQPYGLRLPAGYPGEDREWPLIVYLHGFGNSLDEAFYTTVGLTEEAERQGYIVATALGRGDGFYANESQVDVLEVLADVQKNFDVDEDRVYLMGHSMGGYGTNRIATRFPDVFAAVAPAQGTESSELSANLRHVPWYETTSVQDLDAGGRAATAMYEKLSALGYDATLLNYGMKIHEYSSIYDGLPALFRFFGEHRRDEDPAVVTWVRPTDDRADLGLVYDGAYWLSGVTSAPGGPAAKVEVESGAIAHRPLDPALAQRTTTVVYDPDGPTKRTVGRLHRTTPGFRPAAPPANALRVAATNATALTVDLQRAGLDADDLRITAATDRPVTLTLHDGKKTETVELAAGESEQVVR